MYYLIKIVHYKPIKTKIGLASLVKVMIDMVVRNNNLFELIISDQRSLFTFKI